MKEKSKATAKKSTANQLKLNKAAIERAKKSLDDGAVIAQDNPWREDIVRLLNDALATEIVCILRYKRHHFTATGLESPAIADEFLVHANEESAHADALAKRIVQLGGEPDFSPNTLLARSHADYNDDAGLHEMIKSNLIAERVAIESYTQMIELIGDKDPTTRRLLEGILNDEEEHADELSDWMLSVVTK
ncbi:ferritin-like domain-containing protein [Advenella mimigardefordensis]|uniref:Ferritin-like domain-containing protein n=1 Tax=Advenella mimigardefordensis (strain DSM 17166 / LMG 22922 / DPN7) TaxID=1247726 RepID=W0P959_ADVMD|nr:ferritin-like domain-containing protein [Advenella mimigardefordensis]AHG63389.1 ferritin-like domain-containing protein [Advenella mimigardefordensis DPN7]